MEYCMRLLCENLKDCTTKPCECDKLKTSNKCDFCMKKCNNEKLRNKKEVAK